MMLLRYSGGDNASKGGNGMSKLKRGCGLLLLFLLTVHVLPLAAVPAIEGAPAAPKKEKKSLTKRMKSSLKKKTRGVKSNKQIQKDIAKSQKYEEAEAKKADKKLKEAQAQKAKSQEQAKKLGAAGGALK